MAQGSRPEALPESPDGVHNSSCMKTVILSGGYGTRIQDETAHKPKPMIEIGRRPMLWHTMGQLGSALDAMLRDPERRTATGRRTRGVARRTASSEAVASQTLEAMLDACGRRRFIVRGRSRSKSYPRSLFGTTSRVNGMFSGASALYVRVPLSGPAYSRGQFWHPFLVDLDLPT